MPADVPARWKSPRKLTQSLERRKTMNEGQEETICGRAVTVLFWLKSERLNLAESIESASR